MSTTKTKMDAGDGVKSGNQLEKEPLHLLFYRKAALEFDIEDAQGEITDEQDLIWQRTDLEIKDKLDTYGALFDELIAEKKKLAELRVNGVRRIQVTMNRIENLEVKLKRRLNYLSKGQTLRGHTYSFHPYESKARVLEYLERLSPEELYLTIEIREDYWRKLLELAKHQGVEPPFAEKKRTGKVSELSPDHPAVKTVFTPSIRMT